MNTRPPRAAPTPLPLAARALSGLHERDGARRAAAQQRSQAPQLRWLHDGVEPTSAGSGERAHLLARRRKIEQHDRLTARGISGGGSGSDRVGGIPECARDTYRLVAHSAVARIEHRRRKVERIEQPSERRRATSLGRRHVLG